jgi:hypothetical protein
MLNSYSRICSRNWAVANLAVNTLVVGYWVFLVCCIMIYKHQIIKYCVVSLFIIIKHIVVAIANSTRNDALPLYWCYVSELYILRYLLFLFCNIYIFSAIKTIFSANKILGYTDPPVLKASIDSFTGGSCLQLSGVLIDHNKRNYVTPYPIWIQLLYSSSDRSSDSSSGRLYP